MQQIFPAISLEIIVLILGVLMLLAEAFARRADRSHLAGYAIAALSMVLAFSFFTIAPPAEISPGSYWHFYSADPTSLFFKRIALATTIFVLVMGLEYRTVLEKFIPGTEPGRGTGEFYCLPVFICAGLMFMASAVDFVLIFVSLELVTIGFYVMVAYMRRHTQGLEAGVKYLILGALSTGFLVYGITWIFGLSGETHLDKVRDALVLGFGKANSIGGDFHAGAAVVKQAGVISSGSLIGNEAALLFGIMLVLVGLGFKVAAAPFQLWVPDVYQGAPTPVTAFLSVGSKAAGFIVLVRVLDVFLAVPGIRDKVLAVLVVLAVATLLYGNLAAMPQDNLKRLFAYSSIAHAGYLLIACAALANDPEGAHIAISYYLASYLLMTLLSFLILIVVSRHSRGDDLRHFHGLGKRSPFLAFAMTLAIASLAGIPLTAGFVGKFLVFKSAVQAQQWTLIAVGIVGVGAGFYYYFRVITAMYWLEPNDTTPIKTGALTRFGVAVLAGSILLFGVWLNPILKQIAPPAPTTPEEFETVGPQ